MSNILLNPTLSGFSVPPREFVDNSGNKGYMENPDHWEYVWTPMYADDPNRVPQSLHRDVGYVIAAGWREWEAGYVQRGVRLAAGQRYLCKAQFTPHVGFNGPAPDGWRTHIQWRFYVEAGPGQVAQSDWSSTVKDGFGQDEEHLFVIEATSDLLADVYFKARARYASNACDFQVKSLTVEPVPADFGVAALLGGPAAVAPAAPLAPASVSAPAVVIPVGDPSDSVIEGLELSNEDIDVIVAGLRAMNQVTPNSAVLAGFQRLADALERAKRYG